MSGQLVVKPLTLDLIPQAFVLLSIFDTSLSQENWTRYAADIVESAERSRARGIMTVQSRRGHIYGLSVHDLKHELARGRILEVENFVVADMVGAKPAAELLLETLEEIAREQRCRCMSLRLLNPKLRWTLRRSNGARTDILKAAGYRGEPLRLRKCFGDG